MESNIYELVSENLTHLGGPMGTEYTFDNWRKHFNSIEKAKQYANKDYEKYARTPVKPLKWYKTEKGCRTSDLGFVMYHINKLNIE